MTSASATTIAPPPLTPINSLKAGTSQSTVLPKLQRIPRSGDSPQPDITANASKCSELSNVELPRLTPKPGILGKVSEQPGLHSEGKGLVGGVTTWFPPSSTIQVGSNQGKPTQAGPIPSRRPQFVEYLGAKKFVIIPKHSILSFSPAIAASHLEESVNIPDDALINNDRTTRTESAPNAPDSASLGPESSGLKTESTITATLPEEKELAEASKEGTTEENE